VGGVLHRHLRHQNPHEVKAQGDEDFVQNGTAVACGKTNLPHQWVFPSHHPETALLPGTRNLQNFMENI
jgi:hypothetical protein